MTLSESSAKPDTPSPRRPYLSSQRSNDRSQVGFTTNPCLRVGYRLLEQRALELKPCLLRAERRGRAFGESYQMYVLFELRMEASSCRKASRSCTSCGTLSFWSFICSEPRWASTECRAWVGRGPVEVVLKLVAYG